MALYKFKVANNAGELSELLVEGDSQQDATRRLQRRGLMPLEFLGEGTPSSRASEGGLLRPRFDVVDFTDRLVPLLEARIPLERALGIVGASEQDTHTASIIEELRKGLHEGRRFSQMLRDRSHIFSELYASLVEVGEESGALAEIMADLRNYLNDRRELRSYIVSASLYPLVVFVVSTAMLAILLGFIIPRFANILRTADVEITGVLQALVWTSDVLRGYWWLILLSIAAVVIAGLQARKSRRVQDRLDHILLHTPLLRRLVLYADLARMSRTMAILMRSGVHILETVAISARVLQNRVLRNALSGTSADLRRGERLADALGRSRFLPPFMLRMMAVGEETGNVASMLERTADRFETDLKRTIRRTLSLIEPAVIIVLGLLVAVIVVTMFLAIMEMQSGI